MCERFTWWERRQLYRWVNKVITQSVTEVPMPGCDDIEAVGDWITNTLFDLKNRLEGMDE